MKRRKEEGKGRQDETKVRKEEKQGRGKKGIFPYNFTQINEYYPSEYRVTHDTGAQNSRTFYKIQSKR